MNRKIFLITALLAIPAAASQAWDESGHLLIGEIAARKLRPEAVQKIESLLPLLDPRFNEGRPYNLVTAGLWLDDQRGRGKKANPWSRWHYIDVPCAGNSFVEPPPPHALWALDQATDVLRSKNAEPKARAEALAQIIHIVGDIHQPMHTATRNDRGGNDVPLAPLIPPNPGPSNLHAFWDAACRYDAKQGQITELCPRLRRFDSVDAPGIATGETPAVPASQHPWRQWARETHTIACENGWPKEAGNKSGPLQLTPAFVHASHEIALQQAAKAGTRLAALLNELLGDEPKTDRSPTPPAQSAR